jgi:peptide/nickel transport system permease protein
LSATIFASLVGSLIGIVAGYYRGVVDNILMRGIDLLMAIPYILLALAIVAMLGPSLMNALYAIAIVNIPFFARNMRGVTLGLAYRDFVGAARLMGKTDFQILLSEILPNVMPTIVVTFSTTVGWMILETAGLSFLGLGAQPPQADLGSMLGEARKLIIVAPYVSVIPGAMIFLLVISINVLGDGVRDLLDPRLRAGALSRPAPATAVNRRIAAGEAVRDPSHAILSVHSLEAEFRVGTRPIRAVNSVSFEVNSNECLGIIGESGSGKSATALSLLGLIASPPAVITGGQVLFGGSDLLGMTGRQLRKVRGDRIAYVFQDPLTTLHPLIAVGDQIVEAIRSHRTVPYREAWCQAVDLLDRARIPNAAQRARSLPHELSGGMRQRVGIAMALANDPQFIVADEPTTALDTTVQSQILSLLDQLRSSQNASLLFITHDFGVASQICDRVAVMYAGRIVELGPVDDVLTRPAHPYTRLLIDCVPRSGRSGAPLAAIPGLPPLLDRLPEGCAFAERCERADVGCREGQLDLISSGRDQPDHLVRCRKPFVPT